MTVKERLKKFIEFKQISKSEFGRAIGVSSAFVNSIRKSIQPDKVESIALNFPDLNITWLLTGEGDMLNAAPEQVMEKSDDSAITLALKMLNEQLKVKDEQIAELHSLLAIRLKGDVQKDAASVDVG